MPHSSPSDAASPVTRRNPPTLWDMAANGYSQISVAEPGRLAFLSGQIAGAPDGAALPRDVVGQAPLVATALAAALTELDASPRDVVMLRVYVVDATTERFGDAMTPIKAMLGDAMPSVTTIGVQALFTPELQLEVEMVVRVP